ncbi:MAG: hypothetical protein KQI35_11680 [Bacteroidetes bacterium]|nr:hypothetical protein [Bacteroidota bacterium]
MRILFSISSTIFLFTTFYISLNPIFSQNADQSNSEYWHKKMADPNINFYQLVEEFDEYWKYKDKSKTKGTGYKQFKVWKELREGMLNENGEILPLSYFQNEYNKFNNQYGSDAIQGSWEFLGPDEVPFRTNTNSKFGIGRLTCIEFHPTDPNTIYVGTATSGIWKTTNNGNTWANMNTDQIMHFNVSSIAIQTTNPNIIYVGTGDKDANEVLGQGVWKSTNGGLTWIQLDNQFKDKLVSKLVIQPNWSEVLLAATDMGIYKTYNSGATWSLCTGIEENVEEIVYKPGDPDIVYATRAGLFYRSIDAGNSWVQISSPLMPSYGRGIISVTPQYPDRVYFFTSKDSEYFGLFRSVNSGQDFTKLTTSGIAPGAQGSFNMAFQVDPLNADNMYAGMVLLFKSTDGGANWTEILDTQYETHNDYHALEYSPHTNYLYIGNDGGLFYSDNNVSSISCISDGLNIAQVNRLAVSETTPDFFIAGLNHCGTIGEVNGNYEELHGGDGMQCEIDLTDNQYMYVSAQQGDIYRSTNGSDGPFQNIADNTKIPEESGWFRPYFLDKDDPNTMFAGNINIWRTTNVKTSNPNNVDWVNISDGKFEDDKIVDFMEQCLANGNIIYIVKWNSTRVYRTNNAFAADPDWTEISLPWGHKVKSLETHPTDENILYITTHLRKVFKSTNQGETWTSITGNLPDNATYNILYHIGSNDGLYVGTMAGIYYKDATMTNWIQFDGGLPQAPVKAMKIIYSTNPHQLYVGSWGFGVWKTDIATDMRANLTINAADANVTGTDVSINVGLYNEPGFTDAENYITGYYLSTDQLISTSDFLIGADTISLHPPGVIIGENFQTDVRFFEPEIPGGTYYIGSFVDILDSVSETNEIDNNYTCSSPVTIPNPPSAPANVQATDGVSISKVSVTWDEPSHPYTLYYRIYRSQIANTNTAVPISENWILGTEYEDFSAVSGTTYYYWVKAADNNLGLRDSPYSNYNSGWGALTAPIYCTATKGQFDDHIKISWNPPEGATHYMIYRNTELNVLTATTLFSTWITDDFYEDYDVVFGTEYYYWAKSATSETGYHACSGWSNATSGYLALVGAPDPSASDGTITAGINISWNSISGATHYRLYSSTVYDSTTADPLSDWITSTTWMDGLTNFGQYYYYWVRAAMDENGFNASNYGYCDSGWRSYYPVENVIATDGTLTDHVEISWDNPDMLGYFQVYRGPSAFPINIDTISGWEAHEAGTAQSYHDTSATPGITYFYYLNISDDPNGEFTSFVIANDGGWRKLYAPVCHATQGVFSDKIQIAWDSVPGASAYRLLKNEQPIIPGGAIVDWTTDFYQYDDFDVNIGQPYYYFVQAAINTAGDRSSYYCTSEGFAEKCGNLKEDENYRNISLSGATLSINCRVYNDGPWPINNSSEIAFTLQADTNTSYDYLLGQKVIPTLQPGEYSNIEYQADISSIPYGTWHVGHILPWEANNCQTNPNDDVGVWSDVPFEFTDAMYGTYTIGGNTPDFQEIEDAISGLQTRGISDDVIFNIRPGIYNEQIIIPPIEGSGMNNTITIQTEPSKGDTAEISFINNNDNYTLLFNGCSYITIQNLKISSPGYTNNVSTYGNVITFVNGAHHISILNNTITGTKDFSFNSVDNSVIYYDNTPCHNIDILGNEILNGSYGIFLHGVGEGVDLSTGIQINNNRIADFNNMGITIKFMESPILLNNDIYYSSTLINQCYGVYLSNVENGFVFCKNKIIMEPSTSISIGMNAQYCSGTVSNEGLIGNNFISMISGGTPLYGLILYNIAETEILYNSIHVSGINNEDNYCLNAGCTGDFSDNFNNKVYNNIFSNESNGRCLLYGDVAITEDYFIECNYNDYYYTGSFLGEYGYMNNISSLSSWILASGFDNNSLNVDPEFFSDTDLHTLSYNLNGWGIPQVSITDDIDSEARDLTNPDIGADEYDPAIVDLLTDEILVAPYSSSNLGSNETISIYLYNNGELELSNIPVSYTINNGTPVTEFITTTLFPDEETDYSFSTTADLSQVGLYEISYSVDHPLDQDPGNNNGTDYVEHYHPDLCYEGLYMGGCFWCYIDNFSLNTIQHEQTFCSGGNNSGYGNFSHITTDLKKDTAYTMDIVTGGGNGTNQYVNLWIDFNDNYVFEANEKLISGLACAQTATTYSTSLYIPSDAQIGSHRMRLRSVKNEVNPEPCTNYYTGEVHDYTVNILENQPQTFNLDLKVYLEGPFNGINMNTDLNSILPLYQPYNISPWNYLGEEYTALIPSIDIVDWVLVELRDAAEASSANNTTTIAQQAAFLLNDGSVVDLDGTSILSFDHPIIQSLFVVVWHRNHVGVISANALARFGDIYSYDFTTDDLKVLGGVLGYKELIPGTWGMAGGDGDANGIVESTDKTLIWNPEVGTNGYKTSDFNLNSQVDNKDKNDIWYFNLNIETQVPE